MALKLNNVNVLTFQLRHEQVLIEHELMVQLEQCHSQGH